MRRPEQTIATVILPLALALASCAGAAGPGPQEADFAAGSRVATSESLTLELTNARYGPRDVTLSLSLRNDRATPITLEREGVLLSYNTLHFPVSTTLVPTLADPELIVEPRSSTDFQLTFRLDQAMIEAAVLHVYSLRVGENERLGALKIIVPPAAAFIEAATAPDDPWDE